MQVSKQYIVRRLRSNSIVTLSSMDRTRRTVRGPNQTQKSNRTAALAHAQIRGLFASILAAVSQNIARLARFPAPAHTTHCGDYLLAELRKEPGSNLTRFQNVFSSSSYSTPTPGYVNYPHTLIGIWLASL